MFAAVITVVVAAFIADRIFVVASDYVLRWQEPADRDV
jgi:ABC-type nitrate/sulfonate/bicarbonate transport system permease component